MDEGEENDMAIEVFNRYEKKFLMDADTMKNIVAGISEHMEPDAFNRNGSCYAITNLYYDTEDSQLIRTSLMKPKYKEKLRLRGYGVPGIDDKVYLEIKKKFSGLVNKRRSTLRLEEAYRFARTGIIPEEKPYQNRQVLREIAYMLSQHDLKPMLYLAYDRMAWFDRSDRNLRISFDTNIRSRRTDLRLEAGDWGDPLLEKDVWLMEIKVASAMPVWLTRILSEYEVHASSFSKYGTEYNQMLRSRGTERKTIYIPGVAAGRKQARAMILAG